MISDFFAEQIADITRLFQDFLIVKLNSRFETFNNVSSVISFIISHACSSEFSSACSLDFASFTYVKELKYIECKKWLRKFWELISLSIKSDVFACVSLLEFACNLNVSSNARWVWNAIYNATFFEVLSVDWRRKHLKNWDNLSYKEFFFSRLFMHDLRTS